MEILSHILLLHSITEAAIVWCWCLQTYAQLISLASNEGWIMGTKILIELGKKCKVWWPDKQGMSEVQGCLKDQIINVLGWQCLGKQVGHSKHWAPIPLNCTETHHEERGIKRSLWVGIRIFWWFWFSRILDKSWLTKTWCISKYILV